MGLFKKKEADNELPPLPELPELPSFPELPKEKESTMPSFPAFMPSMPQRSSDMGTIKMPSIRPVTMDISEKPERPEISKLKEPIFVKIDKYREAVMNLEMIKKKLQETSNLLEKIKETMAKEEEELDIWVQEINSIKEKIEIIDKKLFSA